MQELEAWLASSPDEVVRAERKLHSVLESEGIIFNGKPLPVTIKPYCISAEDERARATATEDVLAAISALGQLLCKDEKLLSMVGFDQAARDLLCAEPGDDYLPAFARADALWSNGAGVFVEMNTDSPGMAVYSDVLQLAVVEILREMGLGFPAHCQYHGRVDKIYESLIHRYRAAGGDKSDPMIAIVDWPGVKTIDEQRRLARELEARGCRAEQMAPSELSYRDGRLYGRDREIDLVHRRVLFPEFLARPDEVASLVRAVRDGAVVMVNPLKAYVAGNKGMLGIAHDREITKRLPQAQQELLERFIPQSMIVDDEVRKMLGEIDRTKWVIKSSFGSRGSEVFLGTVASEDQWRAAIEATRKGCWIAQKAIEIPLFDLPVLGDNGQCSMQAYWTNWNPWLIEGKYAGATVRCSMAQVISISARGALVASYSLS